ncbi:hypothetical protein XENTR_v10010546 [Xenopus tropicalis]|nr:hypothetical protein XENTR_v10010546 [Xenopus tropicalis]
MAAGSLSTRSVWDSQPWDSSSTPWGFSLLTSPEATDPKISTFQGYSCSGPDTRVRSPSPRYRPYTAGLGGLVFRVVNIASVVLYPSFSLSSLKGPIQPLCPQLGQRPRACLRAEWTSAPQSPHIGTMRNSPNGVGFSTKDPSHTYRILASYRLPTSGLESMGVSLPLSLPDLIDMLAVEL